MFFMYLSIGLVVVLILHSAITFFSSAQPRTIRHVVRFAMVGLVIALVLFFLRFGLPHLAAITSFVAVVAPLVQRFVRVQKSIGDEPRKTRMSADEAMQILGLDADASVQAIRDAHRRLINKNHPDKGGSEYLASRINEARDVLLANHKDS